LDRFFLRAGAVSGFVSVLAGAFGAHALRDRISPEHLQAFETGARYQMYHALRAPRGRLAGEPLSQ
jgi:uncharacterized membrane protein YgdD (TMEM256/DUF423 family)